MKQPEPTLYLFDGWNMLHAGEFDDPRALIDRLASFVGTTGARGVLVFDGAGPDERIGRLQIRFAEHADTSDSVIRGVSGLEVETRSSGRFLSESDLSAHSEERPLRLGDRVDAKTREKLERLRRGE